MIVGTRLKGDRRKKSDDRWLKGGQPCVVSKSPARWQQCTAIVYPIVSWKLRTIDNPPFLSKGCTRKERVNKYGAIQRTMQEPHIKKARASRIMYIHDNFKNRKLLNLTDKIILRICKIGVIISMCIDTITTYNFSKCKHSSAKVQNYIFFVRNYVSPAILWIRANP